MGSNQLPLTLGSMINIAWQNNLLIYSMTCVDLSFLEMISLPLSRIVLTITIGRYFKYIINISNNIPYFLRLQEVLDPFGVRLREKENEQWFLGRGVTASGEAKSPLTWAEHTHHNLF